MKKTFAAVAAGLLLMASAPAFAEGGCGGSYHIQSVDSKSGGFRVAQSDQISTPTTQTAQETVTK